MLHKDSFFSASVRCELIRDFNFWSRIEGQASRRRRRSEKLDVSSELSSNFEIVDKITKRPAWAKRERSSLDRVISLQSQIAGCLVSIERLKASGGASKSAAKRSPAEIRRERSSEMVGNCRGDDGSSSVDNWVSSERNFNSKTAYGTGWKEAGFPLFSDSLPGDGRLTVPTCMCVSVCVCVCIHRRGPLDVFRPFSRQTGPIVARDRCNLKSSSKVFSPPLAIHTFASSLFSLSLCLPSFLFFSPSFSFNHLEAEN